MRNEEIKKHIDSVLESNKAVLESNKNIDGKLDELIKHERHFKGKASFWGMIGGAFASGIIWLIKYLIAKITLAI